MIFPLFSGVYFQASLTEQSEAQAFLTMQLINKIGAFSDSQRGDEFFSLELFEYFTFFGHAQCYFCHQGISHVKVSV